MENSKQEIGCGSRSTSENLAEEWACYVTLCARQLHVALEESRVEMDGLTEDALAPGKSAAVDLITRLQSVDRLMQRLANVRLNLERFAGFLHGSGGQHSVDWPTLLGQTRETFTMEQERVMFDDLLGQSAPQHNNADDDITLFDESGAPD